MPSQQNRMAVPPGVKEMWAEVEGHRVRYLHAGSGPSLLLIHGLLGHSFSWSENIQELSRHFCVYAPDLLNTGFSDRAEMDCSLSGISTFMLAFMDALGISDTHLCGTSHGGAIALAMATMVPERFRRLVLVAPAHPWSEEHRWQARFFSARFGAIAGWLVLHSPAYVNGFFIKRMYAEPDRMLPGTKEGYNAPLRIHGTLPYLLSIMKCWSRDFQDLKCTLAKGIDLPTLLMWGEKDSIVPMKQVLELKKCLRQAELQVIKDAGHLPYEELPDEFNRRLIEFLRRESKSPMSFSPHRSEAV